MKKLRRLLVATASLAAVGLVAPAIAKDEKPTPAGSIQVAKNTKPSDLPALAKISFDDALKAAVAASPGKVIKGELEVEDGTLMYSFEIIGTDSATTEVEIDAGNGKVLSADKEEAKKEEPKKAEKKDKEKKKKKKKKAHEEDDDQEGDKKKKD